MRANADTRTRIQQVALTLFNEKGYQATSLREIAEELGVTKAALYYHFKTKEDIVASLSEDRLANLQRLLDWARSQPPTVETRMEILRRYSTNLYKSRHAEVMRFFERNQAPLRDHPSLGKYRELMLDLISLLSPAEATATVKVKSSMALFALHTVWILPLDLTDEERMHASLEVALEMVSGG
ncbi:TetR family transcriptional regulator [Microtetraspora sp. NBRC 13810]|uniref:TetR/AcrR family transcriptional regulator n=1 Tax=Microtetraspora sp. NBRC 13810 TaxID=3030990 RepID=UPI0024A23536|nr:TetR/AcrR family transcriptional regulator [Microtetraspora sp. NBRC 13810]GLW06578.1 TetR family transcriptional regulator [Microtetraspora sp. NBRC 13810]